MLIRVVLVKIVGLLEKILVPLLPLVVLRKVWAIWYAQLLVLLLHMMTS